MVQESLGDTLRRMGIPPRRTDPEAMEELRRLGIDEKGAPNEMLPPCGKCAGTGWLKKRAVPGDPDFGKVFPCECTLNGMEAGRQARLLRWSELPAEMATRMTFDLFFTMPHQSEAKREAWRYARGDVGEKWLVLAGDVGTGKTHLACAVLNWRREHSEDGLAQGKYVNAPDFLDDLKAGFKDNSYEARFDRYRDVGLLLLDDLGATAPTPWAEEKLYQLVDHRSRNRMETIITTNIGLNALPERIADRVGDTGTRLAKVVTIRGRSYR